MNNIYIVGNGPLQIVSVNHRPWCGGLFGPMKDICLFGPTIPWIQKGHCVCMEEG